MFDHFVKLTLKGLKSNQPIKKLFCMLKEDLGSADKREVFRSNRPEDFCKIGVPEAYSFIKEETLAQAFSRDFCEISNLN